MRDEVIELCEAGKYFFAERTRLPDELFGVRKISGCDFGELVCVSDRIMGIAVFDIRWLRLFVSCESCNP